MMVLSVLTVLLFISGSCLCDTCDEPLLVPDYTYVPTCSNEHISSALRSDVMCGPVPVVVTLPWPNITDVQQMTPTHITVSRCEGGCHGHHSCVPTSTSERRVSVMLGKCGLSVGKCAKECAVLTVTEHTSCGCDCHIKPDQCTASGQHVFRPEVCACECRDVISKRQCLEQGRTWSEDNCQCGCPVATLAECGLGFVFDYNKTCSCVPDIAHASDKMIIKNYDNLKNNDTEEESEGFFGWEMILIITLGSLLIILSLIVLSLLIRLRTLRRKCDINQSLVPSTLSGQYFPCSDPCTDLSGPHHAAKKLVSSSVSDSDSDRGKMMTDSSLCSDQDRDVQWTDSSESLNNQRHCQDATKPCHPTSPCLESVHLNSNLAIRCNNDNYSIGNKNGDDTIYSSGSRNGDCNHSIYSGGKNDVYSTYSTLGRRNGGNGNNSGYNTVKIVYTNGERSTELTCLMDPNNPNSSCTVNPQYNITSNPMNVYSM